MTDFSDLDQTDFGTNSEAKIAAAPKFPCMSCAGTGRFQGYRTRQPETICFACNGKGHHNKPHFEAMKDKKARRAKRIENKIDRRASVKDALEAREPGLFRFMAENQEWCQIYTDMINQINDGKAMTENQHAACVRIRDKTLLSRAEKEAAKKVEAEKRSVAVDLSPIHAMFAKASEAGLKKLVYRANGLVLSPAKANSANAGGIYVKTKGGEYLGKVMGQKFMANFSCNEAHKEALNVIAANPAEAATAYGKETGECSCCGRELTDPNSIAAGIGPICATKWGF